MALTAVDVLIETVQDWGVAVVFGLPGDVTRPVSSRYATRERRP
jgi:thiamine pyrophosphate-dependent acetolactate synthase large subunit-like protein